MSMKMTVVLDDRENDYVLAEAARSGTTPEAFLIKMISDEVEKRRDYDGWLVREIEQAMLDSDDPEIEPIDNEIVMAESRKQREELLAGSTLIAA